VLKIYSEWLQTGNSCQGDGVCFFLTQRRGDAKEEKKANAVVLLSSFVHIDKTTHNAIMLGSVLIQDTSLVFWVKCKEFLC
jgi:hypothetical protein